MTTTAASTVADADLEAATERLGPGELLLVLVSDSLKRNLPATLAVAGKRSGDYLVDLLGSGPVCPPAVVGPGLSARPAGIGLGLLARERGGLALRLAPQLLDLALELGDALSLTLGLGSKVGVFGLELVVSGYETGKLVFVRARPVFSVGSDGAGHRSPRSPRLT